MIIKKRNDFYGEDRIKYDLKVIDKNGNGFTMMVGGNLDLYWVPDNYKECTRFIINKDDEFLFNTFDILFEDIRENDSMYCPTINGNEFNFFSEDYPEDEANRLRITKEEDEFVIDFIRNEDRENWSLPHRGCNICFCNSGSRVPKVEQQFMLLFNDLAYYNESVEELEL